MRLIDADLLKQNCKCTGIFNDNFVCVDLITLAEVIDKQPTAYDVDKVVEQLDKASDYYECEEQGREHVQMVDLTEAIEIVRAGGID